MDLRPDLSDALIEQYTRGMGLGPVDTVITRWTFKYMLTRRAHPRQQLESLAAASAFGGCQIVENGIGYEVLLRKSAHAPSSMA